MTELTGDERGLIERFGAAWRNHDLDAALGCVADSCVLETAGPAPDGTQVVGKDAIREAWLPFFRSEFSSFDVEETILTGSVVVQRWRFTWRGGNVRGIDVLRVADGLITEKLSYVKA